MNMAVTDHNLLFGAKDFNASHDNFVRASQLMLFFCACAIIIGATLYRYHILLAFP
jgi:hypothetical protein